LGYGDKTKHSYANRIYIRKRISEEDGQRDEEKVRADKKTLIPKLKTDIDENQTKER
jgi:hypothetical protein